MKQTKLIKTHNLSFEDGMLLAKYIYECAIHKSLHNVPEQWHIYYQTHAILKEIIGESDPKRLHEILYKLNLQDIYRSL